MKAMRSLTNSSGTPSPMMLVVSVAAGMNIVVSAHQLRTEPQPHLLVGVECRLGVPPVDGPQDQQRVAIDVGADLEDGRAAEPRREWNRIGPRRPDRYLHGAPGQALVAEGETDLLAEGRQIVMMQDQFGQGSLLAGMSFGLTAPALRPGSARRSPEPARPSSCGRRGRR